MSAKMNPSNRIKIAFSTISPVFSSQKRATFAGQRDKSNTDRVNIMNPKYSLVQ